LEATQIYYVRLENGKNIAQFSSLGILPQVGAIIDLGAAGVDGPFEVVDIKVTHFIGVYKMVVLIVRISPLWAIDQKAIETGKYQQINIIDPATPRVTSLRAIFKRPELFGSLAGMAFPSLLMTVLWLFVRRVFKNRL
jgi:hypothetical protein